jgi:gamma-carbonic anhydrase
MRARLSRRAVPTGLNPATIIESKVVIEPHCVLRSCRVEPKVLIGARSVVCEGAIIESESVITPGSVVPPARRIPSGELWGGNPIRFLRKLTGNEVRVYIQWS